MKICLESHSSFTVLSFSSPRSFQNFSIMIHQRQIEELLTMTHLLDTQSPIELQGLMIKVGQNSQTTMSYVRNKEAMQIIRNPSVEGNAK